MESLSINDSRLDMAADLDAAKSLFEQNGFSRSAAEVRWVYGPVGDRRSHACLAFHSGQIAALYAAVPARFQCEGMIVGAAQSLDTMVDHRFRGAGLFTRLARRVNECMVERGVDFVYGFPNGNSIHGFVSKLGWTALDPVPFLFRPIRLGYALGKLSPRLGRWLPGTVPVFGRKGLSTPSEALPAQSALDDLWAGFSTLVNVARIRDGEFLHRRYARHPRTRYRYRLMERDGRLAGLAIYCIEEKHGGRIGYLMELMCQPGQDALAARLLGDCLEDMRDRGCDGALAWCFRHSPYYRAFVRNGFLPLPERVRPIELHFGYRPLATSSDAVLSRRAEWYLSYSDSDTV